MHVDVDMHKNTPLSALVPDVLSVAFALELLVVFGLLFLAAR